MENKDGRHGKLVLTDEQKELLRKERFKRMLDDPVGYYSTLCDEDYDEWVRQEAERAR